MIQHYKIITLFVCLMFNTWEIPRSGSKAKDGEKKNRRERLNDGDNNGQATHGARKHAWRLQAAWANFSL